MVILVSYAIAIPSLAAWVVLWYGSLPLMLWATAFHMLNIKLAEWEAAEAAACDRRQMRPMSKQQKLYVQRGWQKQAMLEVVDEEAESVPDSPIAAHRPDEVPTSTERTAQDAAALSSAAPDAPWPAGPAAFEAGAAAAATASHDGNCARRAGRWLLNALGWGSVLLVALLAFFLALQAAWLASDAQRFPPPGQFVVVRAPAGTTTINAAGLAEAAADYFPRLHINCTGPMVPGTSTFILEADTGMPGVGYAGIADALAASGRRACWYDRLGHGWSDDTVRPTTVRRNANVLRQLLLAAGEAAPYVLVGHGLGGQLALQYASLYPFDVSGVALLDSYPWSVASAEPAAAAALDSLPTSALDMLRVVAPLGWARASARSSTPAAPGHAAAQMALVGANKQWHTLWVESRGASAQDVAVDLERLATGGGAAWGGTRWPTFGNLRVLVAPAAGTLDGAQQPAPMPCPAADLAGSPTCQDAVAADDPGQGGPWVAQVALAYVRTLSNNTLLTTIAGPHSFPLVEADATAAALVNAFIGV